MDKVSISLLQSMRAAVNLILRLLDELVYKLFCMLFCMLSSTSNANMLSSTFKTNDYFFESL